MTGDFDAAKESAGAAECSYLMGTRKERTGQQDANRAKVGSMP